MQNIVCDGEFILQYVREIKKSEKIGVHGQSLGGSVAVRLGKSADFIFADRTFRGLSDVALFSYGKIAYYIYKFIGPSESNPVQDYLSATCYKLISCDCEDTMIPHLASLKAGISFSLKFSSNIKGTKIFSMLEHYKENNCFNEIVKDLLISLKKIKNKENQKINNDEEEGETPEVDIIGALCNLEIFGRSLYKVAKKKQLQLELALWITMANI